MSRELTPRRNTRPLVVAPGHYQTGHADFVPLKPLDPGRCPETVEPRFRRRETKPAGPRELK